MMMDACASGDVTAVLSLLAAAAAEDDEHSHCAVEHEEDMNINNRNTDTKNRSHDDNSHLLRTQLLAAQQDPITGSSPLMLASQHGHLDICRALLDAGAPWNAVDRHGKCAGDYATDMQHWDVVNLLVDAGTKSEVC